MHGPWMIFAALAAEINRTFAIRELMIVTEMKISCHRPEESRSGPEVDNGGLLPDNRREASFRIFVPKDGQSTGRAATLMLQTKDGDKSLSFDLRLGRVFMWWSRQTFHQVLGGDD